MINQGLNQALAGGNAEDSWASTQAMVDMHPYILAMTLVVVVLFGIWAGFVYPVLEAMKIQYWTKNYSHSSRTSMLIFTQISVFVLLGGTCLLVWTQNPSIFTRTGNLSQFFQTLWIALDYWRYHPEFRIGTVLFWYIYAFVVLDLVIDCTYILLPRLKPAPKEICRASERHAFIIVCHNSTDKLQATLEALLKFCRPYQIFVADNGSSLMEEICTDKLCDSISQEYYDKNPQEDDGIRKPINVSHITYGNKTIAQYGAVLQLYKGLEDCSSPIDIVTLIDDDVLLPSFFSTDRIEREFEDPTKVVLAYPLRAENQDATAITVFQDVEYLSGNMGRCLNDFLGSQLFASGAVATWKVPQLKHILDRHCTTFNGEDLEMGLLLHKLCDTETEKLGMNTTARIGYMENIVVPTVAPIHLIHGYDWLPNPWRRKWGIKPCPCGEHSLFNQRVRSWDPASHQFTFKMLKITFSPRGGWYGPKLFIRILCFWRVLVNLRDYALVAGIIISLVGINSALVFARFITFYFDFIFISWFSGIFTGSIRSFCSGRMGYAVKPDIQFAYPMLYCVTYGLFIRVLGVFYLVCYYLYFSRFPPDVRKQLKSDSKKKSVVESCWEGENSMDLKLEVYVNSSSCGKSVRSGKTNRRSVVTTLGEGEKVDFAENEAGQEKMSESNSIAEFGDSVLESYLARLDSPVSTASTESTLVSDKHNDILSSPSK